MSSVRPYISVLLLVLTVLGLLNVYSDNTEVRSAAQALICSDCELRVIRESRTPVGQDFAFQVDHTSTVREVECHRSFYLVGSYACTAKP